MKMPADFSDVVAPDGLIMFVSRFLDRELFLRRTRLANRFETLISISEIDALLEVGQIDPTDISLVRDGKVLPPYPYSSSTATLASEGITLVISRAHLYFPAVEYLVHDSERSLGRPTDATVYLTPASASGFDTHFDTHDVFILQVNGRKHWSVFPWTTQCPLEGDGYTGVWDSVTEDAPTPPQDIPLDPLFAGILNPGEVLYFPRGFLHKARARETPSLHVTLAVHPPCWVDLLINLVKAAASRDSMLRESLPVGVYSDAQVRAKAAAKAEALLFRVATKADSEAGLDQLELRFAVGNRREVHHVDAVRPETRIRKRPGLYARLAHDGNEVRLIYAGGCLAIPPAFAPALRALVNGDVHIVSDLPDGLADEDLAVHVFGGGGPLLPLGLEAKRSLAELLLAVGFLEVVGERECV